MSEHAAHAVVVEAVPPLAPRAPERPDQHPARVYLASLAQGSRPAMRSALETVAGVLTAGDLDAEELPWASLRYEHLQALRAKLSERYAPKTINRMLSAVRGVLRAAWRLGQIDTDTLHRACDVAGVRGSRLPAGRDIAMRERQQLLECCAADPLPARGARDAAALALLSGTGIRRAEVVALDLASVDLDEGAIRVRGKGNKERRVYLVDGARRALEWWLSLRGSEPGPLLYRVLKGGHIRPRRLRPAAIGLVVERRAREVGLKPTTPHDFRRTFTGDLLDAGADLSAAQALLGHASPLTTARYDRRGERARRKAAELVSVPFASDATPQPTAEATGVGQEALECAGAPDPTDDVEVVPSEAVATEHVTIRVRLVDTKVWRRVRLPLSSSFEALHRLIQVAFDWGDYHLYHFGPIASHSTLEGPTASSVAVGDYLRRRGDRCGYVYDLGDYWLHELEVQAVDIREDMDAWVLAGGGTTPPEDCGGIPGFRHLLRERRRGRRMNPILREQFGWWKPGEFDGGDLPRRAS